MTIEENEFPCYYIDSDQASNTAQNIYKRITSAALLLMFLSTILVSISTDLTSRIIYFDKTNAIILFISGGLSLFLVFNKPERGWYLGRAIAESIKTLSWRYMMHAEPFELTDPEDDLIIFTERISNINRQANQDGFIPKPNKKHSDVLTKKMTEVSSLDFKARKEFYRENRIEDQIKWYGTKSKQNGLRGKIGSYLMVIFQFGAAIYVFTFFDTVKIINLNNMLVFLATSIIGVMEMNKYKELHQSYAFTKQELNIIKTKLASITDEVEFKQFVIDSEQAISREHTMWLARRGKAS